MEFNELLISIVKINLEILRFFQTPPPPPPPVLLARSHIKVTIYIEITTQILLKWVVKVSLL